jgi:hypothetical protein
MSSLRILPALPLLLAGCLATLGPEVPDADVCTRGHIDDRRLEAELAAMPVTPVNQLRFTAIEPPPTGTRPDGSPLGSPEPLIESGIYSDAASIMAPTGKTRAVGFSFERLQVLPKHLILVPRPSGLTTLQPNCLENGPHAQRRGVFASVYFLDASKQPIGPVQTGEPTRHGPFGALSFVTPVGARYVAVAADAARTGSVFVLPGGTYTESVCISATMCFPVQRSGTFSGRASTTGSFTLSLRDDA